MAVDEVDAAAGVLRALAAGEMVPGAAGTGGGRRTGRSGGGTFRPARRRPARRRAGRHRAGTTRRRLPPGGAEEPFAYPGLGSLEVRLGSGPVVRIPGRGRSRRARPGRRAAGQGGEAVARPLQPVQQRRPAGATPTAMRSPTGSTPCWPRARPRWGRSPTLPPASGWRTTRAGGAAGGTRRRDRAPPPRTPPSSWPVPAIRSRSSWRQRPHRPDRSPARRGAHPAGPGRLRRLSPLWS